MRSLEQKSEPEKGPSAALSNLVGALLGELVDEMPDDPRLETVRADLLAASRGYETSRKKDLALRFYLATRSLLREHELLQDRLRKAEKKVHFLETGTVEPAAHEAKPEAGTTEPGANAMGAGAA